MRWNWWLEPTWCRAVRPSSLEASGLVPCCSSWRTKTNTRHAHSVHTQTRPGPDLRREGAQRASHQTVRILFLANDRCMTFCQESKAHHFSRRLKARITVIGGYPLPLRLRGFLKMSNVTLAVSGIFRRGLVGTKTPSKIFIDKIFFLKVI